MNWNLAFRNKAYGCNNQDRNRIHDEYVPGLNLAWEEDESAAVLEGDELQDGEGDEEENVGREEHRLVLRDALPQATREQHNVHHDACARSGQPQRNLRRQLPRTLSILGPP